MRTSASADAPRAAQLRQQAEASTTEALAAAGEADTQLTAALAVKTAADDAARECDHLCQAYQGQITAQEEARAELRVRAEHAEAALTRTLAQLDRTRTELAQTCHLG